jgi:hypothetical protein
MGASAKKTYDQVLETVKECYLNKGRPISKKEIDQCCSERGLPSYPIFTPERPPSMKAISPSDAIEQGLLTKDDLVGDIRKVYLFTDVQLPPKQPTEPQDNAPADSTPDPPVQVPPQLDIAPTPALVQKKTNGLNQEYQDFMTTQYPDTGYDKVRAELLQKIDQPLFDMIVKDALTSAPRYTQIRLQSYLEEQRIDLKEGSKKVLISMIDYKLKQDGVNSVVKDYDGVLCIELPELWAQKLDAVAKDMLDKVNKNVRN